MRELQLMARASRPGASAYYSKAGCKKVFRETASGAKTNRIQLRKALDQLDAGDVLVVTPLDRLARSTRDLLNTLATAALTQAVARLDRITSSGGLLTRNILVTRKGMFWLSS